ncbi:MAG: head-tail connector protein [Desulfovibrio sp.]|jgi:hypothetical protein|nr:head-tail connector protein [Desulfovibrio sp.]
MDGREYRLRCYRRLLELEGERKKGWEKHWKDLSRHFLPRRARFLEAGERTNDGDEKNRLQDDTGILAVRVLASGMQGGLTSPARPWFSLTLQDEDAARREDARLWLHAVYERMAAVFARSNFYDQIHMLYRELSVFGTGAMLVEEDAKSVVRCRTLTVGEYALDVDAAHRVDTLYRRVRMTPRQIAEAWPDTCPDGIRRMADDARQDWLTLLHAVEPNPDHREGLARRQSRERPWRSVYMTLDRGGNGTLEDSGYYEFPALCPRWNTTASDIYGSSPAMDALADCRMLQKMAEDGFLALELEVKPPLLNFTNKEEIDVSPGAVANVASLAQGQQAIVPMYQVKANLRELEAAKDNIRRQIRTMLYNDLFMMVSGEDKRMTATEVDARNTEKMLLLGPVIDRLRSELFQPLIERVFGIMDRAGHIPPAPPELEGRELKVEFTSILAQAQKAAGLNGVLQTFGVVAQAASVNPEVLDKFDMDEMVDQIAEMNGVPPRLIRSDEAVAELRARRKRQTEQTRMLEMLRQGADTAKTGAEAAKAAGITPEALQTLETKAQT